MDFRSSKAEFESVIGEKPAGWIRWGISLLLAIFVLALLWVAASWGLIRG